jgi:hypothetical protein
VYRRVSLRPRLSLQISSAECLEHCHRDGDGSTLVDRCVARLKHALGVPVQSVLKFISFLAFNMQHGGQRSCTTALNSDSVTTEYWQNRTHKSSRSSLLDMVERRRPQRRVAGLHRTPYLAIAALRPRKPSRLNLNEAAAALWFHHSANPLIHIDRDVCTFACKLGGRKKSAGLWEGLILRSRRSIHWPTMPRSEDDMEGISTALTIPAFSGAK